MATKKVATGGAMRSAGSAATGGDASAVAGATDREALASESDEPHWKFRRLQAQYKGLIERKTDDKGVVLLFTYGDGDRTTARGDTTSDALDALIAKMGGLK